MSSPLLSKEIPSFLKTDGICPRSSQLTFLIVNSLLVIAARPIQLPISIMSGNMVCSVPCNFATPSTTNKLDPIPEIFAPTVDSVNELPDEEAKLEFVTAFREMMRTKNVLNSFSDFKFEDVSITEQTYEDYKSKYLDIYESIGKRDDKEKVSILEDIDFGVGF